MYLARLLLTCSTVACLVRSTLGKQAASGRHIGLFTNTGPYSHDAMMYQLAEKLANNGHKVTVIQIRASALLHKIQTQIWHSTVPFGDDRPNLKSLTLFLKILDFQTDGCEAALRHEPFVRRIKALDLDLLVMDFLLNECALGMSLMLNVPRVYLSNYPMTDTYMDYFGIPSNPAYLPTTVTKLTSPMDFVRRMLNCVCRLILSYVRGIIMAKSEKLYRRLGYKLQRYAPEEKRTILYATPSEFLLDSPRPLTHTVKYFGCSNCMLKRLYNVATRKGVILVSFGTIPNAHYLPERIISVFRSVFANLQEYSVLLQLPDIQKIAMNMTSNVVVANWIPLQELLGDPSVKLFITHGGIGSVIEAITNAVPILGIPLQGDQVYNLGRLIEKGIADVIYIPELSFMHDNCQLSVRNI
ncbi:unnamed protein product [Soboliphyme baturini]|uniref:UDP-glucuronosyltransferase n=1 Tax=Soboliphyme baturini TaxID=241478 RepID=A0A183IPD1_9BILA|nr:unnamed protein product [Soboliphyme baturini]